MKSVKHPIEVLYLRVNQTANTGRVKTAANAPSDSQPTGTHQIWSRWLH